MARAASSRRRVSSSRPTKPPDLGYESGTTVSSDYTGHSTRFTGKVDWVQIDLGDDAKDADHYIMHDERLRADAAPSVRASLGRALVWPDFEAPRAQPAPEGMPMHTPHPR